MYKHTDLKQCVPSSFHFGHRTEPRNTKGHITSRSRHAIIIHHNLAMCLKHTIQNTGHTTLHLMVIKSTNVHFNSASEPHTEEVFSFADFI